MREFTFSFKDEESLQLFKAWFMDQGGEDNLHHALDAKDYSARVTPFGNGVLIETIKE